jgi:hypothetical protein
MRALRPIVIFLLSIGAASVALLLYPLRLVRRAVSAKRFSLWTGTPILTIAFKARAERLLGVDARSLAVFTYHTSSAFDYDLSRWRALRLVGPLIPFFAFVWACVRADRIHCFFDRALLAQIHPFQFNAIEAATYRLLGIQLFVWSYGGDVRVRPTTLALGSPNCCVDCTEVGRACVCDPARHERNLATLGRHATAMFTLGDMNEYVSGVRTDVYFWPLDLDAEGGTKYAPAFPQRRGGEVVRVVHAPNHRMFKGTRHLEEAVRALRDEGVRIELVMVEGRSNTEALAIYRSADIIFDQCLIGFHGYTALEAMALGKPVMCFIRKPDAYLLDPDTCPIVNTHVATLRDDLRRLVEAPEQLGELGRRGRAYVEKHFTLEAFSRRLDRAYREIGVSA